jgi:hypothetical protein
LRCFTGFLQAVFTTFLSARITAEVTFTFKWFAVVGRQIAQGPGRPLLEASGGVNLATVAAIAATGVDVISVGALTHSVRALDIGLDAGA